MYLKYIRIKHKGHKGFHKGFKGVLTVLISIADAGVIIKRMLAL